MPNSPFTVYVEGKVGDPSKCRVSGPGIEPTGNIVDKPTFFEVDTTSKRRFIILNIYNIKTKRIIFFRRWKWNCGGCYIRSK